MEVCCSRFACEPPESRGKKRKICGNVEPVHSGELDTPISTTPGPDLRASLANQADLHSFPR